MAKAQPTALDKIKLAIKRAQAGNGRSLAALFAYASLGDLTKAFSASIVVEDVLDFVAMEQAERDRIKAEKREAQRAARAALRAKLGAEYLGGVRT